MAHHDFRRTVQSEASHTLIGVEINTADHVEIVDVDADAQIVLDYKAARDLVEHLLDALDILKPATRTSFSNGTWKHDATSCTTTSTLIP